MINEIKTRGIVLRRTNYGEADRILNIITPDGKLAAIAKAARRAKSKLAGGIEMFSLIEVQIRLGRGELGIITGARLIKYYDKILQDYDRMELAGVILRKMNIVLDHTKGEEYFDITKQCLEALNEEFDVGLVEAWFWLNLKKVMGEEVNLYRDINGKRLEAGKKYVWSGPEAVFLEDDLGVYGENEIKLLRLMAMMNISKIKRIKITDELREKVLSLVRIITEGG